MSDSAVPERKWPEWSEEHLRKMADAECAAGCINIGDPFTALIGALQAKIGELEHDVSEWSSAALDYQWQIKEQAATIAKINGDHYDALQEIGILKGERDHFEELNSEQAEQYGAKVAELEQEVTEAHNSFTLEVENGIRQAATIEQLTKALRRYGQHDAKCFLVEDCVCGLKDLLAALNKQEPK